MEQELEENYEKWQNDFQNVVGLNQARRFTENFYAEFFSLTKLQTSVKLKFHDQWVVEGKIIYLQMVINYLIEGNIKRKVWIWVSGEYENLITEG